MPAKEEGSTSLATILKGERNGPRKKSLDKLKDTVRSETRRNNGRCMKAICADLNLTLKGWFGYFQHSARTSLSPLTATCEGDCAVSSGAGRNAKAGPKGKITLDGQILTSPQSAC